jgi:hypothetical protein
MRYALAAVLLLTILGATGCGPGGCSYSRIGRSTDNCVADYHRGARHHHGLADDVDDRHSHYGRSVRDGDDHRVRRRIEGLERGVQQVELCRSRYAK